MSDYHPENLSKLELQKALLDGFSVVLVPRPWPKIPEKHFMPSEIAIYLKKNGFDTSKLKVHVFEFLTNDNEHHCSARIVTSCAAQLPQHL